MRAPAACRGGPAVRAIEGAAEPSSSIVTPDSSGEFTLHRECHVRVCVCGARPKARLPSHASGATSKTHDGVNQAGLFSTGSAGSRSGRAFSNHHQIEDVAGGACSAGAAIPPLELGLSHGPHTGFFTCSRFLPACSNRTSMANICAPNWCWTLWRWRSPRRPDGVTHRSEQGSQYTSVAFGNRCKEAGVRPWMGSVGDFYDNAMCESFLRSCPAPAPCQAARSNRAIPHTAEGGVRLHRTRGLRPLVRWSRRLKGLACRPLPGYRRH